MSFLAECFRRLQYLFNRRKLEEELKREMESHREMMGTPVRFGNTLRLREESQDVWGWRWIDDLWHDAMYGARQLRQSPIFTSLALLTLAIGIGATTFMAVFLKDAMFKEPPVRKPAELRQFAQISGPGSLSPHRADVPYPVYRHVRDNTKAFSDVVCLGATRQVNIGIRGRAERGTARSVSGNYFQSIGVPLALGREITPDDDITGNSAAVAVLSHGFWQRVFGGDSKVLGQSITLNGAPFVIVGVTAQSFYFVTPRNPDVFFPVVQRTLVQKQSDALTANQNVCQIIARIKPEASATQALGDANALVRQASIQTESAVSNVEDRRRPGFGRVRIRRVGRLVDTLDSENIDWLSVTGAVFVIGSVVLIACSNIAGMLLARASARRSEIATRLALGAGRRRLVRQLLTESVLLCGVAGLLGICLGTAGLKFDSQFRGELQMDLTVVLLIAGISVATGIAVGLAPALNATRMDLTSVMKQASPGSLGRLRSRAVKPLIAVQVALSFLLLITAGLHIHSLSNLVSQWNPRLDHVSFQADPRSNGYSHAQITAYYENAAKRLDAIPGVYASSVSREHRGDDVCVKDSGVSDGERGAIVWYITPHHFETEKMRLSVGRNMEWSDRDGTPKVAVVTESFARRYHPGRSPLGMTFGFSTFGKEGPQCNPDEMEVIGVVADENKSSGFPSGDVVYLPFAQQKDFPTATFTLRVQVDPATMVPAIRRTMLDFEPNIPVFGLEEGIQRSKRTGGRNLTAALALFGVLALLQASLGIYGTLSYSVSRRTAEIGVRIALGAHRASVVHMILRETLIPVLAGVGVGFLGAPVLAQVFIGNIYGSGPTDHWKIAVAAAVLVFAGVAAASTPAWRASRLDPMRALHYD